MKPIAPPSRTARDGRERGRSEHARVCSGPTATPSERAFSSPSARRSSLQRRRDRERGRARPARATQGAADPACDRSPISQNSMPFNCAFGREHEREADERGESRREHDAGQEQAIDVPVARAISETEDDARSRQPRRRTRRGCIAAAPAPTVSASSAPSEAPPETPSTYGSASALLQQHLQQRARRARADRRTRKRRKRAARAGSR